MKEGRIGKEYYDGSDYFDADAQHLVKLDSPFQRYRVAKVLELYEPGREEHVLDLGCGWGTFCWVLGHRVKKIVGLDFSRKSIDLCEARQQGSGLGNVSFVCADARQTGLQDESFDLVIAADLVEHLYPRDSQVVIGEAHRLLKQGGRLSIWTPHRGHFLEMLRAKNIILKRDVTHVDYKSMHRLKSMVEAVDFHIEKSYYAESHIGLLDSIERALLTRVPLLRRRIALLARKQ